MCQKPREVHEVLFFVALYFISLGTGGHKPCLESFGADQFDDDHLEEGKKKMSYFNWWNLAHLFWTFSWCNSYSLCSRKSELEICRSYPHYMAVTILTFFTGKIYYRYRLPEGSPLTPLLQILVAVIRKKNYLMLPILHYYMKYQSWNCPKEGFYVIQVGLRKLRKFTITKFSLDCQLR